MSQQSFAALGVSENVVQALAARGIHTPFQIQEIVVPDALEGVDILAQSPTGSGKTLAFALPLVERTSPQDGDARRARPRADARARGAGRRGARGRRTAQGPPGRARLRRRRARRTGQAPQGRPLPRRDARPPPGLPRPAAWSSSTASRCSCSTRPTGCSTWASSPRSSGSCATSRATARRCSSRPRSTARSASWPAPTPGTPSRFEAGLPAELRDGRRRSPLRLGHPGRQGRRARRRARGRPRPRARLRPHQARRRPARAEAEPPRHHAPSRSTAT